MAVSRRKTPARKATTCEKPATRRAASPRTAAKKAASRGSAAPKAASSKKTAAPRKSAARKVAPAQSRPQKATAPKAAPKKTAARRTAASKPAGLAGGIKPYKPQRDEAYMNKPQREHFTEILLAWKRELMEEVDRTVHHMQDEAGNFPDPNDRASQESEFSLELRTRDRERKLLRKIDEALKDLEVNEYGWCESCGAEIGIRRLEARPTATLCIDCKTLDEIRERQIGR